MVQAPLVPLGNLLRESPRNGLSPRPSDTAPGLPILRISAATSRQDGIVDEADYKYLEVSEREALQYRVQQGDLLACRFNGNLHFVGRFALYRGYLGKHHIYPDKLIRFRVDTAKVLPDFALLVINSRQCRAVIESFCSTTAGNIGISAANLKTVPIPVPPLHEQRRIVARIGELAARIERARGLRQHAIADVEAIVPQAIAQALEVAVVAGHLGDVLVEKPRNGWSPRCDNRETGVPVLSLSAVTGFRYQEHAFKRTSEPTVEGANYWLCNGDLLITRSNTQELVGHAAIYNGFPSPCIYPDLMMRLVVDENRASKRFVHAWLRSPIAREYIRRNAIGSSPSMKKISQSIVMKIPFPTNLHVRDQQRIVTILDEEQAKVDAIQRMQAASAAELDALLPAVLSKAFESGL